MPGSIMIDINFDTETNILKITYSETIDKADIERLMQFLGDEAELPVHVKLFIHTGSLDSSLKMRDLLYFAKVMRRATGRFKEVRAAVYATHSTTLTLSKMYERLNMERNTKFKTFTDEGEAVSWLMNL